ncbi:MAG: signal peptidase II [Armatimonadetes bacterium]|nr:signal peptidase II [Armatimonadota bacterium]
MNKRHTSTVIGTTLALVGLDQLVKYLARTAAQGILGKTIAALWPGVFELKLVFNKGIAFGMLQGKGIWLAPVAVLISVGALVYSIRKPEESRLSHITMVCLSAGAVGNLIDRSLFGQVTDMFWIRIIDFPVFNVADVLITIAGCLLAWTALQELQGKKSPDRNAPSQEPVIVNQGNESQ